MNEPEVLGVMKIIFVLEINELGEMIVGLKILVFIWIILFGFFMERLLFFLTSTLMKLLELFPLLF
jgi:hypothetical protein